MTMPIDTERQSAISAFSDSADTFLRSASPLSRLRDWRQRSPRFERATWRSLADNGWPAILVDEALGGLGLDLDHAAAIAQVIGRHPLPEPYLASGVQAPLLLQQLDVTALRDRLLTSIAAGELIVGVAWQEQAGEIDCPNAMLVQAKEQQDGVHLSGSKRWVAPGSGADGWLVVALCAGTPAVYWLPSAAIYPAQVVDLDAVDGSSIATLRLDGTRIPASNLLASGEGVLTAVNRANDAARLVQAAELVGVARRALDMTLDYVKTRVQFGRPIGANQSLQHRLVDAELQTRLASAAIEDGLRTARANAGELAIAASRAKARCADVALRVTRLAVQLHGAIGFTDEHDLGLYVKRAWALSAALGGAQAHRLRYHRLNLRLPEGEPPEVQDVPSPGTNTELETSDAFRRRVRTFLRRHYPEALRHPSRRLRWHEVKEWYLALSRQGWLAPAWPKEYGGMGLDPEKLLAFVDEMEAYGVARMPDQGLINLGPILIRYGTDAQRREYLPPILAGQHVWCQGYSEPNAGSDLASLRTEAVPTGEDFVVNGQKIWTTLAQDATHIFLLVRTDKHAKKQAGISFLLVDLATPGVTVRPIRNLAGEDEFCEVFFDDVRVPKANLVGEVNQGWAIAKALLGFERLFVGSPKTSGYALERLRDVAIARGKFLDPAFVSRFAELELDVADLRALYAHYADIAKRGEELPASISVLKIFATETYSRIAAETVAASEEDGAAAGEPLSLLMNATITTIYGGTNEIQRNIVAKHVLDLPS